MFICEKCGRKEGVDSFWFVVGPLSRGNCEECGEYASCYDYTGYKNDPKIKAHAEKVVEFYNASKIVFAGLAEDKAEGSVYYAWQANIAMAFKDEYDRARKNKKNISKNDVHAIANQAAKYFLDQLCGNSYHSIIKQ